MNLTIGPAAASSRGVSSGRSQQRGGGIDPVLALLDNDSYPALDSAGALLRTGPTGTYVNDLLVILVSPDRG